MRWKRGVGGYGGGKCGRGYSGRWWGCVLRRVEGDVVGGCGSRCGVVQILTGPFLKVYCRDRC